MSGMRCSVIRILTRRAAVKVSSRLRRTSRASGRVLDGSMCFHQDSAITAPDTRLLDRTDLHALLQRGQGITRGDEFMRPEDGEAGIRDGSCNRMVVQLLRVIQLVATWHPAGMEMADVGGMLPDRPDDVAFHYLHVIDVVQQLHPRRADGVDD